LLLLHLVDSSILLYIHNHISLTNIDGMLAIDSFVRRYLSPTFSGNTSHGVVLTPYEGFFQIPSQSAIK